MMVKLKINEEALSSLNNFLNKLYKRLQGKDILSGDVIVSLMHSEFNNEKLSTLGKFFLKYVYEAKQKLDNGEEVNIEYFKLVPNKTKELSILLTLGIEYISMEIVEGSTLQLNQLTSNVNEIEKKHIDDVFEKDDEFNVLFKELYD